MPLSTDLFVEIFVILHPSMPQGLIEYIVNNRYLVNLCVKSVIPHEKSQGTYCGRVSASFRRA